MGCDDEPCAGYLEGDGAFARRDRSGYLHAGDYAKYVKVLDVYHRADNAMFVPESGNAAPVTLGTSSRRWDMERLGGLLSDWTIPDMRMRRWALRWWMRSWWICLRQNYELVGAHGSRDCAAGTSKASCRAVAEDPAVQRRTMESGLWTATVAYGSSGVRLGGEPARKPGSRWVGLRWRSWGLDQFLVTGASRPGWTFARRTGAVAPGVRASGGRHVPLMASSSSCGSGIGIRRTMG